MTTSARNPSSGIGQLRRFVPPAIQIAIYPPPAFSYTRDGDVLAWGLKNPVGFAYKPGTLTNYVPIPGTEATTTVSGGSQTNSSKPRQLELFVLVYYKYLFDLSNSSMSIVDMVDKSINNIYAHNMAHRRVYLNLSIVELGLVLRIALK